MLEGVEWGSITSRVMTSCDAWPNLTLCEKYFFETLTLCETFFFIPAKREFGVQRRLGPYGELIQRGESIIDSCSCHQISPSGLKILGSRREWLRWTPEGLTSSGSGENFFEIFFGDSCSCHQLSQLARKWSDRDGNGCVGLLEVTRIRESTKIFWKLLKFF